MSKFLTNAAEKILAKHGNDLSGVLVLMPNQRSCTYFRNALQQLATKAIIAPEIITLQNYALTKSALVLADSIELITELYGCYKTLNTELSLDEFISIARVMLDDFNQLDLQVVDAPLFFKNLELLQSMKTYVPGEEPDEYKLKYRKFWEEFGALYHSLRKTLVEKGKGYRGMILRSVAENLTTPPLLPNGQKQSVYLIGLNGLHKAEERIVEHLLEHTQATMLWDADRYYVNNESNEAGTYLRKYRTQFGIGEDDLIDAIRTTPKNIQVIGAAKNIGQVKVTADILQNKLRIDNTEALDTVIVLPDEKLLSPLLANLPRNVEAVNITMGLNMTGSHTASFLEIVFRLYENSQRYQSAQSGERFYYKDVFELLQHSFFTLLFGVTPAEEFTALMKKQNRILIRREEFTKSFSEAAHTLLYTGSDAKAYAEFLLHIANKVLDKLIEAVRNGNETLAPEAEIAFRLRNTITNTTGIFSGGDVISIKTYINLLRQTFRNERVPLEGDPVQGLQIMGLLETRSLDFKNVIILSANEGILPAGKFMNTYIPFELQREFLTTYKERDAMTAYLFYRLLHRAENVFILYNTEPDELGGGEKSRFILQLEHELKLQNKEAQIYDLIFAVDPPPAMGEQEINIAKKEEVLKKLTELLTGYGMSPSALNTYINCSLQYYFRYIADLKQDEDMEESLEASTIGDSVHYALENIYKNNLGEEITVDFVRKQLQNRERIEALVREKLAEKFDNESLSRGKNLLLLKVCIKLTEEFLKHEAIHLVQLNDAGAKMTIEMLEGKLEHSLIINGKQVKVRGKVDRVEQIGDIIHIADYKTSGKSTIPVLNDETWETLTADPKYAKSVQLMVYAWLYFNSKGKPDTQFRSGIYWLRESKKSLDTLRVSKDSDLIERDTLLKFEEKLIAVLSELLNENIPFSKTVDEERCAYCEFVKICNRD